MSTAALLDRLSGVKQTAPGCWLARCPAHEDRSPSLSIRDSDNRVLLHCFAGCSTDAVLASLGLTFIDLFVKPMTGENLHAPGPATPKAASVERNVSDWSEKAERIWRMTVPLGELAKTYLQNRGCVLPPRDGDLRFLPGSDRHPPSLCGRITDAVTAKPISLHFTELLPDGSGRGARRLIAGHRKKGGVIRLWPDEAVTYGLAIGEGIETCLAAAHLFTPVWACVDAGNLARLPVLDGIEALTIFADHDAAGLKGARECARRWRESGRDVRVLRARLAGADIADLAGVMEGAA